MAYADVVSTNFRFKVSKIKDLNVIWTPEFIVQGIPWKVKVCKQVFEGKPSLAVYFHCVKKDKPPNWSHAASASFKLLSFNEDQNAIEHHTEPIVFDNSGHGYGFSSFIAWDKLFDGEKNYVKNDSINFMIEINSADSNEATKSNLICTNVKKYCDEGCLSTFRLTVTNIEQLMAVQSLQVMLRNTAWYFRVYKSLSGHIYMCLDPNNTPMDFSCDVQMNCKLISTNGEVKQIEQTCANILKHSVCLFIRNFVSWVELLKPQNGYVENGSIVIEVELKMGKPEGVMAKNDATDAKHEEKSMKIECAICFEGFRTKEVSSVPCGHMFCTACITQAIGARKKCPKCNTPADLNDLRRIYIDNLD